MNIGDVNPQIIEDVKDAFEKIKAAPMFSYVATKMFCMYRGPNGTKCVIGHMIDDESYGEEFEGENVTSINLNAYLKNRYGSLSDTDEGYLHRAQQYHDRIAERNHDKLKPADTVFSYENFEETRL